LRRGPTIQTKMSLANAGIYCISQPLSGAMEDCSIFQVQQLQVQMLYRRRCCMSAPQRLVVERSRRSGASATRRQSSARYDGEMLDSDRWTSIEPTAGAVLWDCFRTPHKTAPVTGEDTERNSIWRDLNSSNNLPPGGGWILRLNDLFRGTGQSPTYQDVNISTLLVVVSWMCLVSVDNLYGERSFHLCCCCCSAWNSLCDSLKTLLCHYLTFRITLRQ